MLLSCMIINEHNTPFARPGQQEHTNCHVKGVKSRQARGAPSRVDDSIFSVTIIKIRLHLSPQQMGGCY